MVKITVWDLPLRLFHWLLVVGVFAAWYTVENNMLDEHVQVGIALFSLMVFRLLWGFFGSETARFSHFLKSPAAAIATLKSLFVKSDEAPQMGHNPLGGYVVILMLLAVLAQATMGLFANDDIFTEGPLYHLVGKDTSDAISWYHIRFFNVILGLVALHLLAIAFYQFYKKLNLTKPMITGKSDQHDGYDTHWSPMNFILCCVATYAFVWAILNLL